MRTILIVAIMAIATINVQAWGLAELFGASTEIEKKLGITVEQRDEYKGKSKGYLLAKSDYDIYYPDSGGYPSVTFSGPYWVEELEELNARIKAGKDAKGKRIRYVRAYTWAAKKGMIDNAKKIRKTSEYKKEMIKINKKREAERLVQVAKWEKIRAKNRANGIYVQY